MKNIIIAIIIILSSTKALAQNATTEYDTCQYLQQYAGEWRCVNGTDTIKIYLRANRYYSAQYNDVRDALWGWHEYKHGNTIVESDYSLKSFSLSYYIDPVVVPSWSIWLRLWTCSNDYNILRGSITDFVENRESHEVKIIIDPTKRIMTWHQQREGSLNSQHTGMTLPQNFVLIKQ